MLIQNPEVTNKEYYGKLLVFSVREAKVALGYRLVKGGTNTLTIVHRVIFCCITHQWRPFVA